MRRNVYDFETKGGLKPLDTDLHYAVSSNQLMNYLQSKINGTITAVNASLQEGATPIPAMELSSYTKMYGRLNNGQNKGKNKNRSFSLLVLILPAAAAIQGRKPKKGGQGNDAGNILESMIQKSDEGGYNQGKNRCRLITAIDKTLEAFIPKNPEAVFHLKNPMLQGMNLSPTEINEICSLFHPKMVTKKDKHGNILKQYAVIAVEPSLVLNDMLDTRHKGDNRRYTIESEGMDRVSESEVIFKVRRIVQSGNGKHKKNDNRDIYNMIESGELTYIK